MVSKRKNQRTPQSGKPNFSELDSVGTEPTENPVTTRKGSKPTSGTTLDVGPAVLGTSDSTPLTVGHLKTFGKIAGVVIGGITLIGGPIWWAATIQSDVNSIESVLDKIDTTTRSLENTSVRHDERLIQIKNEISRLSQTPTFDQTEPDELPLDD